MLDNHIPLSLYIHFPWCVKKCPYCDFNSHALKTTLPESAYIEALLEDFRASLPETQGRPLISIFMGGGTPSLFSPKSIGILLHQIKEEIDCVPNMEITLEANPGTIEHGQFAEYVAAGVTRVSLGVQSFSARQLCTLGRIHSEKEAEKAIVDLKNSALQSFNLDLMYALPEQTVEEAMIDLSTAIAFNPPHLSWYQLTLEPNTPFYHQPPKVPSHDLCADIEEAGLALLKQHGYTRYEISAYHRGHPCLHNLNYWSFGDYLGIGAGAHSKITNPKTNTIVREIRHKHPKTYLKKDPFIQQRTVVSEAERPFEYMLNSLRLMEGLPMACFSQRTGLPIESIWPALEKAQKLNWLSLDKQSIQPTPLGHRFLNDLVNLF